MIDPRTIEVFYWVVALGSFRGAADKLHTTQPAVSGRIAQLEQACGARLLERDRGRKVVPTAKGLELMGFAERVLALQAEMAAALIAPALLRGTVRLGTAETIVHTWLGTLVSEMHSRHPALTLDITVDVSARLQEQLVAGELDVALLLGPVSLSRARNVPLCHYRLAWVVRPGLLQPGESFADAVTRWPLITYPRETSPYRDVSDLVHAAGGPAARIFSNSSLASMVRMVRDGIGIGVIAEAAIGAELASGMLEMLPGPPLPPLSFTASFLGAAGGREAAVAEIARSVAASARSVVASAISGADQD